MGINKTNYETVF